MAKKRKHHEEEHADETWLIPYADLLTLLLALFIILFASSEMDSKKYDQIMRSLNSAFNGGVSLFEKSQIPPITLDPTDKNHDKTQDFTQQSRSTIVLTEATKEQLAQMKQELEDMLELQKQLNQYIADNGLSTQLETKLNEDQLVITIRDNALFGSGSAEVKPEARRLAQAIGAMLAKYPNYQIEVAGHTDNIPISTAQFETNWDLSSKRALNFFKILLQTSQIDQKRFSVIGRGEFQPITTNATAEGRAMNRRVEVSILRNIKTGTSLSAPTQ
ncbi:flagellar motor protein MotB [Paenibacillus koleovorans]|uniref:flagellar motor protein MotB n=1 Tax=Paenibacillus koleovorans TaxID=121608 RepID=UPI000FDAECE7|nr:flagellar motor protein MotB [Paenibacillus koleovorans]